jgi:prepilin-type N-terminal cleavage/methylation domain-containing protein
MAPRSTPPRGEGGFTLIELMISLVIFSFAIAGVLAVAVSMTQGLRDQRQAVEAETAARVPLDFIQDALRQASPGSPTLNIFDVSTCSTSAVNWVDNETAGTYVTGTDQIDVIYASGAVVTSLRSVYTAGTTSITVTDGSQFVANDYIVISDTTQGHFVKIMAVVGNTLTLASQLCTGTMPAGGYALGSLVIRAQHAVFFITSIDAGKGDGSTVPTLMMNPTGNPATNSTAAEPLAEGVEDLQVVEAWDPGTGIGIEHGTGANDDTFWGNNVGDTALSGTLRSVRITLSARTTGVQVGQQSPYQRPALEDHAASAFDNYRRRLLKTTVEIRNIGVSP